MRATDYRKNPIDMADTYLVGKREDPAKCQDVNLAAAQHYTHARFFVEDTIYPTALVVAMIYGYSLLKSTTGFWRTGICPTSPPSGFRRKSGMEGVYDGGRGV